MWLRGKFRSLTEARMKIITGSSNQPFAQKVAEHCFVDLVPADLNRFNDGEICVEVKENIRGKDVFLVNSTCSPVNESLMELLIMIDTAKRSSARRITAVIPYYGYARQDRKSASRTPITAKLVADLLTKAGADRILTMDLHAGQIQGFFDIPVDDLTSRVVFAKDIETKINKDEGCVFVSPDAGGAVRARKFADMFHGDIAIVDKRRPRAGVAEVMALIGDVKGKHAILVDDIVDSGGTLCKAADAILEAGALSVRAYITHGVLSNGAQKKIDASNLEELVISDSIPYTGNVKKIRQVSVAPLFGEAMRRITNEESVSSLFQ
jgi:ribose-phosphate pyrophosphokinase